MTDDRQAVAASRASRELTAAVGSAARGAPDVDVVLDLGAHHPSSHGMLRLRLQVGPDGDILAADPLVGAMHRGAEKLFEVRDYRQILVLANRHDWLSAFGNELALALAVERMLGIEVPARAVWARTALAELNRILHHLHFLGALPGAGPVAFAAARAGREAVQDVLEQVSGGRVHFMLNQVGGLKQDLPAGWRQRAGEAVAVVQRELPALRAATVDDDACAAGLAGAGIIPPALTLAYGLSGPVARASGLDLDLRRDDPYLAYGELGVEVVLGDAGDALARARCLLEQVRVSSTLALACLDRLGGLPPGPVNVPLPKVVRAPEGATYAWTENGSGINGYYLVSRGERTPWRLKLRTASFNNVSVLAEILPGSRLEQLVAVLGSLFFVVGDVDK